MPVTNTEVAKKFRRIADILDIKGENRFRIRSYRNAAGTIENLAKSVAEMVNSGQDLTQLSGIGKDLAEKIEKIAKTGKLPQLEKLEKQIPEGLVKLMDIEGLGPKKIKTLHEELGIDSFKEIKKAAKNDKIKEIEGFGKKTQNLIKDAVEPGEEDKDRIPLKEAEEIAQNLIKHLKKSKGLKELKIAGSYRRRKETVGDLDMLAVCKKGSNIMSRFTNYEDVKKVISKGKTRSTVKLKTGLNVDLRVVAGVSFGSALQYFTGSKAHSVELRKIANKKKYKLNEYGVYKGKKRLAGKTENAVYKKLGLKYIEPEMRENRGEIEAAKKKNLPDLVKIGDIRGDLHVHTKETDGKHEISEIIDAARERDYEYIAIADHSKHVSVAKGMDKKRLSKQLDEIDKINSKLKRFTVLKSAEVDILEDGSLDLPDDILKELDFTTCSVHYKFRMERKKQTERIIKAMDNRYFNILGHPTGRMIQQREPIDIDIEKIIDAAKKKGCIMELNASPDRLDLNDIYLKMAKQKSVKIALCTDMHHLPNLDFMRYGVGQARRGWLEAKDIVNTMSLTKLKKVMNR